MGLMETETARVASGGPPNTPVPHAPDPTGETAPPAGSNAPSIVDQIVAFVTAPPQRGPTAGPAAPGPSHRRDDDRPSRRPSPHDDDPAPSIEAAFAGVDARIGNIRDGIVTSMTDEDGTTASLIWFDTAVREVATRIQLLRTHGHDIQQPRNMLRLAMHFHRSGSDGKARRYLDHTWRLIEDIRS